MLLLYAALIVLHLRSFFFFFSSRRRHTRCSRDWSSDVCSSDLFVFDTFTVLEQWVEKGKAPDQIIAAHFAGGGVSSAKPDRTRPLCPYPLVAKYKGSGSTDDAANFVCSQE